MSGNTSSSASAASRGYGSTTSSGGSFANNNPSTSSFGANNNSGPAGGGGQTNSTPSSPAPAPSAPASFGSPTSTSAASGLASAINAGLNPQGQTNVAPASWSPSPPPVASFSNPFARRTYSGPKGTTSLNTNAYVAGGMSPMAAGITSSANALGIRPQDLATTISYETAGTFNPLKKGPTTQWGLHQGLIQFGQPQAKQFGVDWDHPLASQLGPDGAVVQYMKNAGVQPGMGLKDVYSAVNAGRVGRYNASDANNGGAPGTVAQKVASQMADHQVNAANVLSRTATPSQVTQITSPLGTSGSFAPAPPIKVTQNAPAPQSVPAPQPNVVGYGQMPHTYRGDGSGLTVGEPAQVASIPAVMPTIPGPKSMPPKNPQPSPDNVTVNDVPEIPRPQAPPNVFTQNTSFANPGYRPSVPANVVAQNNSFDNPGYAPRTPLDKSTTSTYRNADQGFEPQTSVAQYAPQPHSYRDTSSGAVPSQVAYAPVDHNYRDAAQGSSAESLVAGGPGLYGHQDPTTPGTTQPTFVTDLQDKKSTTYKVASAIFGPAGAAALAYATNRPYKPSTAGTMTALLDSGSKSSGPGYGSSSGNSGSKGTGGSTGSSSTALTPAQVNSQLQLLFQSLGSSADSATTNSDIQKMFTDLAATGSLDDKKPHSPKKAKMKSFA